MRDNNKEDKNNQTEESMKKNLEGMNKYLRKKRGEKFKTQN